MADCNTAKNVEAMQRGYLIVTLAHLIVLHISVSEF